MTENEHPNLEYRMCPKEDCPYYCDAFEHEPEENNYANFCSACGTQMVKEEA